MLIVEFMENGILTMCRYTNLLPTDTGVVVTEA